jgi:hypothetical protein
MTLTDPNARRSTVPRLVAEPEAVAAAPFAFAPREPDPAALAHGGLGLGMAESARPRSTAASSNTCAETACRHPRPVTCLMIAVRGNNKQPASLLGLLPSVERLDQVESRPRYPDLRVHPPGGKGLGDQPKALVIAEPRRPRMATRSLPGGCDTWEHAFEEKQTTVRRCSAASTQCRMPLRTRDCSTGFRQSPTRPGHGLSSRSTRGSCPGGRGACREPAKFSPRPASDRL